MYGEPISKRRALRSAALSGDVEHVRAALAEGIRVDVQLPDWTASKEDRGRLREAPPGPFFKSETNGPIPGGEALHLAALGGSAAVTQCLLSAGADPNSADRYEGQTPLHCAAFAGHREVAELLLEAGGTADALNFSGAAPLDAVQVHVHLMLGGLDASSVAQLLVDRGAALPTLLMVQRACKSLLESVEDGNLEAARRDVRMGADVNCASCGKQDTFGPLHLAAKHGDDAIVEYLLSEGANPARLDEAGRIPLDEAASGGHAVAFQKLARGGPKPTRAQVETLVAAVQESKLAQMVAVSTLGDVAAVQAALTSGCDFQSSRGTKALHCAVNNGHVEVVEFLLLRAGVAVDATADTNKGLEMTPLRLAVNRGHEAVVTLLLDHGADVHRTSSDGYSPIAYSSSWKYQLSIGYSVSSAIGDTITTVHPPDKAGLLHPACVLERFPEWQRPRVAADLARQARERGLADRPMAVGTMIMLQGCCGHYVGWEKQSWGSNIHLIHMYMPPDESSSGVLKRVQLRDIPTEEWSIVPRDSFEGEEHEQEVVKTYSNPETVQAEELRLDARRKVCAMGFTEVEAIVALLVSSGNLELAVDQLLAHARSDEHRAQEAGDDQDAHSESESESESEHSEHSESESEHSEHSESESEHSEHSEPESEHSESEHSEHSESESEHSEHSESEHSEHSEPDLEPEPDLPYGTLVLPAIPLSPVADRTLASSNYKNCYSRTKAPQGPLQLGVQLGKMLERYCEKENIGWEGAEGEDFLERLQAEAMEHAVELSSAEQLPDAIQRMWTSFLQLRGKEFCQIINDTLRSDSIAMIMPVASLARAINQLCVTVDSPRDGIHPPNNVCYRGGGFDDTFRDFFVRGRTYRQPVYLSTSFSAHQAEFFISRSPLPSKIRWTVWIDPERKCNHVNLVTKRVPGLPDEQEYLFAPYSVFTVMRVAWRAGSIECPHEVDLVAAVDNKVEPEDLPLAPWS